MVSIGLIQMPVKESVLENLEKANQMIKNAKSLGAQIVVLPEMFCCLYQNDSFLKYKESENGEISRFLSQIAKTNNVYLIGGSIPEAAENDRIYNTCLIFDQEGTRIGKHRKVHLFDVQIENGQQFKESDVFTPGNQLTLIDTVFGRLGIMICFDIRFPEWSRMLTLEGAQVIIAPSAFNMTTGPAHWQMTFKARALDNQVFFIGCSPARNMESEYVSYGHSIITSPWGDVVAECGHGEEIIVQQIDLEYINKIRRQLPLLNSRRKDLYH